ncbi:hypothetical protein JCM8547_003478 [Rhodosporidiobolus lusitaniae]
MAIARPPPPPPALVEALKNAAVPVESLEEACRACDGCDEDAEDLQYPKGVDIDYDSEMLGGVTAFGRQVLISTGKSDWPHNVCEDSKDLPGLVEAAHSDIEKGTRPGLLSKLSSRFLGKKSDGLPGVYPSSAAPPEDTEISTRLSILASSFLSSSHEPHKESAIVLPDFKVVSEVRVTKEGADELVKNYLAPAAGRAGTGEVGDLRSWPLPYHAVVVVCSHKKRDKRCHISAPLLISQFHHHLEKHGLAVDERGDHIAEGPSIEEWEGTVEEKEVRLKETLQGVKGEPTVGLFKVSHLGGHKFAGNVIIYFPNGSVVWYGRATPADVHAIVDRTIIGGKVITELLRGGLGLAGKNGEKGVLGW